MTVDTLQMIVLPCADLAATLRFYHDALGLPVVGSDERMAILRAGLLEIALEAAAPPCGRDRGDAGVELVFKARDIAATTRRLQACGFPLTVATSAHSGATVELHDPDGRPVHLVERPV